MSAFLSGFVSIIGSPNVGKSTLMNRFVGQKVSIVSSRAQTTRNREMGVLTRPEYQIVFLDTPGVTTPQNRLGEYMLKIAYDSLNEVEAVLFLADGEKGIREKDSALLQKLASAKAPVLAAINKIDTAKAETVAAMHEQLRAMSFLSSIVAISAETGEGVKELEALLASHLVEGPKYFPDDMVTDLPERVICAEMIREKTLILLREEVPHGVGVSVDKMIQREDKPVYDIWATIYCEREGHKGIIIGKGGSMLKKIGEQARRDMEWMLGMRVNLQLWVKVKEDWRNSVSTMRELGYE